MEYLYFIDNKLDFRGCICSIRDMYEVGSAVMISLFNDENDFVITAVVNETYINDVLQTSADMIIETLSNG